MRFYLEIKNNNDCYVVAEAIKKHLEENGFVYDKKSPELVISVGGDGTLLRSINHYLSKDPLFIGINEGSLGFLCQFNDDEITELLDIITSRNFKYIRQTRLLKAIVNGEEYYALNELRFESNNGISLGFNIDVDNSLLEHFAGDGICFSSSIGSTGINKGLGGAVVDHDLEIIQVAEKVPINSRVYKTLNSPLIVNGDTIFELYNFSRINFLFTYDSMAKNITLQDDTIRVSLSKKKVSILLNKDHSFIDKVNESFIG